MILHRSRLKWRIAPFAVYFAQCITPDIRRLLQVGLRELTKKRLIEVEFCIRYLHEIEAETTCITRT